HVFDQLPDVLGQAPIILFLDQPPPLVPLAPWEEVVSWTELEGCMDIAPDLLSRHQRAQVPLGERLLYLGGDEGELGPVEQLGGGHVRMLEARDPGGPGAVHVDEVLIDPDPLLVRDAAWPTPLFGLSSG